LLTRKTVVLAVILLQGKLVFPQTSLLLNGGFEEVNTCTEYSAECGVEAWFYLRDVKAQMLSNETNTNLLGSNSFGIFYNWGGYTGFTPVIGTLLPCGLQQGKRYTFKGIISARLNPKLILKPGICLGQKFYVPKRPFSITMKPVVITGLQPVPNSNFFSFEYNFIADGTEQYLTFGTYTEEDTLGAKKKLVGTQTISLVLDNFQLLPEDKKETYCRDFLINKEKIYNYNFRHKEMDYSLFGKGELAISFTKTDSLFTTIIKEPVQPPKADTLKLGDVFFDFNKANLKPAALEMLATFFTRPGNSNGIDSIYVEGHTDSIGSDSRNLQLSLERSESIRQWLLKNNILTSSSIQVHAFGRSKPVASNSTPQGRALNRRVELIVFRKIPSK
jgi:outer membrane protein OmpA-like peptidoglycan-associated protein